MAQIALEIVNNSQKTYAEVCGPISTGGLGSVEANLQRLNQSIQDLKTKGVNIFDQIPFEEPMQRLKSKPGYKPTDLLEGFYLPLLESGKIKVMYFLPDWRTSFGARWEHDQAQRLGIKVIYISE